RLGRWSARELQPGTAAVGAARQPARPAVAHDPQADAHARADRARARPEARGPLEDRGALGPGAEPRGGRPVTQWIYRFGGGRADGGAADKPLLGGKGANLAEMTRLGIPVPPGFTITTECCAEVLARGRWPSELGDQLQEGLGHVERCTGRVFGDRERPLLVSVRSGAAVSMPGMMDTILNLGLCESTLPGLSDGGNERFAWDSYRRLIQMLGDVV